MKHLIDKKKVNVALIGNPNCGKTSLFNQLTGLKQKIGNYPGITVDKKSGTITLKNGQKLEIIDLPGAYSIYPRSDDEKVVFEILNTTEKKDRPDVVIAIADATNLKRNLLLFSQVYDMGIPVILALNMMDVAEKSGISIDHEKIQESLNVPVICINARTGKGIKQLKETISKISDQTGNKPFYDVRTLAPGILEEIRDELSLNNHYQAFLYLQQLNFNGNLTEVQKKHILQIVGKNNLDINALQAKETIERYAFINEMVDDAISEHREGNQYRITNIIDNILTHKVWGYLIFLTVLMAIFQSIFAWAQYPMDFIDGSINDIGISLKSALPEGAFFDLITEGILPGIGGIMMFIPQIALLFAFIALLEESGYMARVVFLMDKIMRQFGLNGRSIVPLISGMACAIPAIMATRSIDNWKDRLITIFVIPLISCSARLPVYTILIALVVPETYVFGIINLQGLTLMALYLIGFIAAVLSALIFQKFIARKRKSFLIMELPLYKFPRLSNVAYTIWEKSKTFVWEAGRIILAISIILWVLASYGPSDKVKNAKQIVEKQYENQGLSEKDLNNKIAAYKLEHSYAGLFGKSIEPIIKPIGFDWKIGIAIITSFAAREVFVGTMATIYSIGQQQDEDMTIKKRMQEEINPATGLPLYTPAVAFSLIIFYAFAMQCMSTLAIVLRETKSIKWPILQLIYMSALAYVASFIVYTFLK